MSFLQPWMLFALPLAALPVIIHLINQRRYQTTRWAAMMFLLAANRMNRGYAKIRQWAILILRTLVIAALVLAVGRPLSSGLLGGSLSGSAAGNTIVLLDRSPSMQSAAGDAAISKLQSGVANLSQTLQTMGVSRLTLIESNSLKPIELESPATLVDSPATGPSDASADIPTMLLEALDYTRENELGQTDIWIISDLKDHDWQSKDGRWLTLRQAYADFGRRVRFRLLAFPQPAPANRSVRVDDVRLSSDEDDPYVSLSVKVAANESGKLGVGVAETVVATIELDGARSTVDIPFDGVVGELKGHRIAVTPGQERGWGRVSIPADANVSDNDFLFTFDRAPPRRTVVVTDDAEVGKVLQLAAQITSEDDIQSIAEVVSPGGLVAIDWSDVALVLWHAGIADAPEAGPGPADVLKDFAARGGSVIFFPPDSLLHSSSGAVERQRGEASVFETSPRLGSTLLEKESDRKLNDRTDAFGFQWGPWKAPEQPVAVASWRGEADLLSATLAGAALPVGDLRVDRYAQIIGDVTPLASLTGGDPLMVRTAATKGAVYACATTPRAADSSLARDGVVLYVMIQRALTAGARALRNTGQVDAGHHDLVSRDSAMGKRIAGRADRLSTERAFTAGVYTSDISTDPSRWLAVNRSPGEDRATTLEDAQVEGLFRGLVLDRFDQSALSSSSIVEEVWRAFLIIMLIAMIGEACLCLPRITTEKSRSRSSAPDVRSSGTRSTGAAA